MRAQNQKMKKNKSVGKKQISKTNTIDKSITLKPKNNKNKAKSKNEDTAQSIDDLIDYKFLKNIEYYKISHSFELSIIYDSILLILCFLRVLIFFSNFELIRPIYMYIRSSFYRAIPFLFIYIILILIFALYGH